jgi:hypothetical protein
MIRVKILFVLLLGFATGTGFSQVFIKTAELFKRPESTSNTGKLNIVQNPSLDTLISRYILANKNLAAVNGHTGLDGFRIQIFNNAGRNAREESGKTRAAFLGKFPDVVSYQLFAEPGYWIIRVGDYRTKAEAKKHFMQINKAFPDAYIVPDYINYPDLNKN